MVRIGLWNIDHPESGNGAQKKDRRFSEVTDFLLQADCDAFIITEANAAIKLPGYFTAFSDESPFIAKGRKYGGANSYHQVAIYCRMPIRRVEVAEPINGVLCEVSDCGRLRQIYGNVITIKDQWMPASRKRYSDRLNEQIEVIRNLRKDGALVGGDFNLRLGWPQKLYAHRRIKEQLAANGWVWPTELQDDTVQHVLHSPDLQVELALDTGVKYQSFVHRGLSDHPFIRLDVSVH